jgi:hypothetical protein
MPLQPRKRSKLFKEYAIADLSRYRQGRVGLRWRTQREVVNGTGQFACGAKGCGERRGLASFEVPFAYQEAGGWLPCGPLVSGPAWAPAQRDQAAPHAWLACDGAGRCALVRWLAVRCAAPLPPWHPQGSGSRRW